MMPLKRRARESRTLIPRSPTPNSSFSGVISPRTMFLSISSTRITRPSTHIGSFSSRWNRPPLNADGGSVVTRLPHGGTFCTMAAISSPSRPRVAFAAAAVGMLAAWTVPSPRWPSLALVLARRGRWPSAARRPDAPVRTGYAVPQQLDRQRLRPSGRSVARRGVQLRHLRQLRRGVGAGPPPRERAPSPWRRWSSSPAGRSTTATGSRPSRRRWWSTPPAWCSGASSVPVTATDLWAAVAEARRARQHARRVHVAVGDRSTASAEGGGCRWWRG